MILNEIGIVACYSSRTKAYLQMMLKNNLKPSHFILLHNPLDEVLPGQVKSDISSKNKVEVNLDNPWFDLTKDIIETLTENNISYEIFYTKDINDPKLIDLLKLRPEKYFIYSGFGGSILRKDVLNIGKQFLHIHTGKVPHFKGSTTIYYSILKENKISASAIFLSEKLDDGPLIKIKDYSLPKDTTIIDYIYDPYVRSNLLVDVLKDYVTNKKFICSKQEEGGETYFIIHPVLKHIAILSSKSN